MRNNRVQARVIVSAAVFLAVAGAASSVAAAAGVVTVNGRAVHQTTEQVSNVRVVGVPGTNAVVATWTQTGAAGVPVLMRSVSSDGVNFSRAIETSYDIKLQFGTFDPLADAAPAVPAGFQASPSSRLFIVQLVTPVIDAMRDNLASIGATVRGFLPESAVLVEVDQANLAQVRALPYVRWVGAYEPAFKLDPNILNAFYFNDQAALANFRATYAADYETQNLASFAAGNAGRWWIQLMNADAQTANAVADAVVRAGGAVRAMPEAGNILLLADLNPAQLQSVLASDGVLFAGPWGPAGTDMDTEREISGANYLEGLTGISGEGVRGEVMDSGLRATHVAFQGPASNPTVRANGSSTSHGTNVFGIVFGNGASNAQARALLPDAAGKFFYAYTALAGFGGTADRNTVTAQLVSPNFQAVFQTNSWGSPQVTTYQPTSAAMDNIIFNSGLLICNSQSNTGNQNSRPEAWAKNVLAVGGITHQNTLTRADDTRTGTSIGPAADGRVKPEIAHFYDNILTTASGSDTAFTPSFGGTSGATPITCGYMGLIFQMWHQQLFTRVWNGSGFQNSGGGASVFASRPFFTTARALAGHSAFRYNWLAGGSNGNITRAVQGWGMIDLRNLHDLRNTLFIENERVSLRVGERSTYQFDVPAGAGQFNVSMVYADPGGTTSATVHRINDLSVRVTGPTGTFWWGNNGLAAGNFNTPGGISNRVDTFENVFLNAPAAGRYTVEVFADEVNADGNLRTPGVNDVAFALVVSGGSFVLPTCPGDWNGDGVIDFNDLLEYLNDYNAFRPRADINADGIVDFNDLLEFLNLYNATCP